MDIFSWLNARVVAVATIAIVILLGLLLATGGTLSTSINSSSALATVPPAPTPAVEIGVVKGAVSAEARHLSGHTWRFVYTVSNGGTIPIAGFEINAPRANLFKLRTRPTWTFYGSGVCGESHGGVLVYWSTNAVGGQTIQPGSSATFGFDANTSGPTKSEYSLSWNNAKPKFGFVPVPAASKLAATGSCR